MKKTLSDNQIRHIGDGLIVIGAGAQVVPGADVAGLALIYAGTDLVAYEDHKDALSEGANHTQATLAGVSTEGIGIVGGAAADRDIEMFGKATGLRRAAGTLLANTYDIASAAGTLIGDELDGSRTGGQTGSLVHDPESSKKIHALPHDPPVTGAGKIHELALALGKPLVSSSVMHGIALHQGRPGLGSFAPPPRAPKSAQKPPHPPAAAAEGQSAHAGPHHAAAESRGFRAILAEAKAQVAEARQAREARQGGALPRIAGSAFPGHSFAPPPMGTAGLPLRMAARNAMTGGGGFGGVCAADFAPSGPGGGGGGATGPESLRPAPALTRQVPDANLPGRTGTAPGGMPQVDFEQALNDYAFRASRLPPNGGAGFNPTLSPLFAGIKIPG